MMTVLTYFQGAVMQWLRWMVVGFALVFTMNPALADEGEVIEAPEPVNGYDQAILKFNAKIKSFASWEQFKAAVLSRLPERVSGTCYTLTDEGMQPVLVTPTDLELTGDRGWRKTSGKGWRQDRKDRTFIEYRVNDEANVLIRAEGYKPRFFFASTKRICEFPL